MRVEHRISGGQGSLAASLDYALSKQPDWLTELFGVDSTGICSVRRLILRTNPERKRPGPVVLCFSEGAIENVHFRFTFNGSRVESVEDVRLLLMSLGERLDLSLSTGEGMQPRNLAA